MKRGRKANPANRFRDAILTLCLATGEEADRARLRGALAIVAEVIEASHDGTALVAHPALVVRGLDVSGLALPKVAQRRFQAAALREEKRSAIAAAQAGQLRMLFQHHAIEPQPLRGWHFASLYYPEPLARHCHALRWLVSDQALAERLMPMLAAEGWNERRASPALAPHKIVLGGKDRINVELHTQVFPWTDHRPDGQAQTSPEFTAIELIGSTIVEPQSNSGLWLVDLAQLLRRQQLDAVLLAAMAKAYGIAATVSHALETLADLVGSEASTQQQIHALRAVLEDGQPGVRDAPVVADLRIIQTMAAASPARLLLKALQRPDLLAKGYALRRQRARHFRSAAERRQFLRDHHIAHRQ
jgi:nicotinamidase-related amidase